MRGRSLLRDAKVIRDAYDMANRGAKNRTGFVAQTLKSRRGCIRLRARAKLETKYGALAHGAA